jgi:hypothetical protein
VNLKRIENANMITMAYYGTQEQIKETSDIIGMIKVRKKVKMFRIQNVTVIDNGKFNLFSISQMLCQKLCQKLYQKDGT